MSRPPNAAQPRSGGEGSSTGRSALMVAGVVVAGSIGLSWVASRLFGNSGGGGGGGGSHDASRRPSIPSVSSSSSFSSASASSASFFEKQLRVLESAVRYLESHPSDDSSSAWVSASVSAREESRPKMRLERALASARKVGRKAPPGAPAPAPSPTLQLRLLAVQLIIRYYRRYPAETHHRHTDHLKAWALLAGRAAEAEAATEAAAAAALAATDPASSYYPEPSLRQQLERMLLECALELHDLSRMREALYALLRVPAADASAAASSSVAAAAASSAAAASPSSLSPGSSSGNGGGGHPYVLPSSLLLSLDRDSCDAAFHVSPLLGHWLWTFQLGQRLFGERRAREPGAADEHTDLYEMFHEQALGMPADLIDYAVVWETARLRLAAYASADPSILPRLGLTHAPPSTLPYNEDGQLFEPSAYPAAMAPSASASIMLPSLSSLLGRSAAAAAAAAAARAPSLPSTGALLEPLPSSSLCSEEYEIRAYSSFIQSVSVGNDDAPLRASVLDFLLRKNQELFELPSADSVAAADSSLHLGVVPNLSPARRILRQGALFSMVSLSTHPIPLVGAILSEPLPLQSELAAPQSTRPGTRFSMQGYTCNVLAAAPAMDEDEVHKPDYVQFEHFTFVTPGGGASSERPASAHSGITNSMVEFSAASGHHALSGNGSGNGNGASSATPSALHSPVHRGDRLLSAGSSSPGSPSASAHLFASASFATLTDSAMHLQHFPDPAAAAAASSEAAASAAAAVASSVDSDLLSSPDLSVHSPPGSTALDQYAAALPGGAEIWNGTYRITQEPKVLEGAQQRQRPLRPRIQVDYALRIVVQRVSSADPAAAPAAAAPVAASSVSSLPPFSFASSMAAVAAPAPPRNHSLTAAVSESDSE